MSLFDFFRLIYRNIRLLVIIPVVMALVIFFITLDEKKSYESSALIYTGLASGYNIESGSSDKVDYKQVNAAYDNLMSVIDSRFTLEEVGLRLLAFNLIQKEPSNKLGPEAFKLLQEVVPMEKRTDFVVENDFEKTYENLVVLFEEGHPLINKLIRGEGSHSVQKLRTITIKRVKSSDMISLSYQSYDPGLCQNTLDMLVQVFIKRYRELKENETGNVVAYFEQELQKAKENLNTAEDELTNFRVKSRVINYGEETKALAIKKQNAMEEYALRKMNLKATEAALRQLEEKLEIRKDQLKFNINLVESKKELSRMSTEIATMQSGHEPDTLVDQKIMEQEMLKRSIQNQMERMINLESTPEGIPGKQLITDWLNNLIQYNRDLVAVEIFKKRLDDIDTQYDNFTPMGSTIDRMERQISVYEREYLEVLHGLNMARLRAQNIELTSNLDVLDKPQYPFEAQASKRMFLILMGLVVGFMGTLSVVVVIDLLDHTLKKPEKAAKETGLELIGAFPVMNKEFREHHMDILPRITGLISSKLRLEKYLAEKTKQELLVLVSVSPGEGKTTVTRLLFDEFVASGEPTVLITPTRATNEPSDHVIHYDVDRTFNGVQSLEALTGGRDLSNYRYVLLEIPPLNQGQIPIHIIEKSSLSLLIARSDRAWLYAQKNMVANYVKLTGKNPLMILNGIKLYYLDQLLGEVPVKRTKLVNWIRSVARFEFAKSNFNLF